MRCRLIIGMTFLLALPAVADVRADDAERWEAFEIATRDDVDESLFIMRFVERCFTGWPREALDSEETANWAVDQQLTLKRLHRHAVKQALPERVVSSLVESLEMFRDYDEFLVEIGAISEARLAQTKQERDELIGKVFDQTVMRREERIRQRREAGAAKPAAIGRDDLTDVGRGIVIGKVFDLIDESRRQQEAREKKKAAEKRFKQLRERRNTEVAQMALRLESLQGWEKGEAGFVGTPVTRTAKVRPRDPFARLERAHMLPLIRLFPVTSSEMLSKARSCLEAARLVPEGGVYDVFRSESLADASHFARLAAIHGYRETGKHGTDRAIECVRICRTRLDYDPDLTGLGRMELAHCLKAAGDFEGAYSTVREVYTRQKSNPAFAYEYACICSLIDRLKDAAEWFERSLRYQTGKDVKWSRTNPELAALRAADPGKFESLTTVDFDGNIVWGVFNDDYRITNNSKFPLTNFECVIAFDLKSRDFTKKYRIRHLAPGQSRTFSKSFSVSRSDYVGSKIESYKCDQE